MNIEELRKEYENTLKKSYSLLDENSEWINRYRGYITKISDSFFPIQCKLVKKVVHLDWPLAAYLNIDSVKKSGMNLDLRLFGTSIATLFIKRDSLTSEEYKLVREKKLDQIDRKRFNSVVRVSFKKDGLEKLIKEGSEGKSPIIKKEFVSKEYWDLSFIKKLHAEQDYSWHDHIIDKFRSIIKRIYENQGFIAADEHAHESNVLHLMKGNSPYFNAITPVLLEGAFFQMTTPFMGSKSKDNLVEYAAGKGKGGGIDILARKKYGAKNELCVIEIKDKYESGEEPIKAIKQAIAYAGFLMRLIQAEYGEMWLKYFGINSSKEKCNINAVIAMPYKLNKRSLTDEDTVFDGMVLDAGEGCTITLNYMYYDEQIFYSKEIEADNVLISIKRDKSKSMGRVEGDGSF